MDNKEKTEKISTIYLVSNNEMQTDGFMQEESEILKRKLIKENWRQPDCLDLSYLKRIYDKSDGILIHNGLTQIDDEKLTTIVDKVLDLEFDLDKIYLGKIGTRSIGKPTNWSIEQIHLKGYLDQESIFNYNDKEPLIPYTKTLSNLNAYLAACWCKLRPPEERVKIYNEVHKQLVKELEQELEKIKVTTYKIFEDERIFDAEDAVKLKRLLNTLSRQPITSRVKQLSEEDEKEVKKCIKKISTLQRKMQGIGYGIIAGITKKYIMYGLPADYDRRYLQLSDDKIGVTVQMPFYQQVDTPDKIDRILSMYDIDNIRLNVNTVTKEDKKELAIKITKIRDNEPFKDNNVTKLLSIVKNLYKQKIYCEDFDVMSMRFVMDKDTYENQGIEKILREIVKVGLYQLVSRVYTLPANKILGFWENTGYEYITINKGERW